MRPTAAWMFCALMRVDDVVRREAEAGHAVGVEPHPHAVVGGRRTATTSPTPRHALEAVDDVDGRVVATGTAGRSARRASQTAMTCSSADDFFLTLTPCAAHLLRQLRLGQADAVLHVDGVDVGVGADREGDGERVAAVVAAGRLHVEHVVDADRPAPRSAARRSPRRPRRRRRDRCAVTCDLRRHDVGELRDRDLPSARSGRRA